ncbi:transglycosylase SLT domain-containing protein [Chitinasiproducens palmae]|nr:transglycosylase SLT domain-containing protein [Chitinasiproducens palmae]
MRLLFCVLSALMLTACAGTATRTSDDGLATDALASNQDRSKTTPLHDALRRNGASRTIDLDHASVDSLAVDNRDIWTRVRDGFQLPDLDTDLAQSKTDWYASRPEYVERMIGRSRLYLYHIVEQLEQRHMPTELALLPFVESAYNPQALSVAKAAGMWQFIPGTGRDYNLKQNMFQDERRDVLASTDAALAYLSRLHDMFGDWQLALAAYNWGEGNVQRAINRNAAQGLPTDYLSLRMPAETRNYVPKLQAVKNLIVDPRRYGLNLPSIPNHPYFVTVTTSRDIDVKVAAKLADLSLDDFKALNPSFTKPVILGATSPQILLPFDNAARFERNLKHFNGPLSSWTTYTVDSRERPAALAAKIGVDADTLVAVNKIPAGMRLKPGSTVLVPKSGDDDVEDISADIAERAVLAVEPDRPDTRRMLVRVARRESLDSFAQRYGVSESQVRSWNRLRGGVLPAGARVVVHVPAGQTIAAAPRAMPIENVAVSSPSRGIVRASATVERRAAAAPLPVKRVSAPAPVKKGRKAPVQASRKTTTGNRSASRKAVRKVAAKGRTGGTGVKIRR